MFAKTTENAVRSSAGSLSRCLLLAASLSFCAVPSAVSEVQPVNAPERTQCKLQDTAVTVEYRRIRRKGRKIFGGVVPYGRVWETGFKQPPTFTTGADLMMGGKAIPAGRYSLYTIPNPDAWTMIVRKMIGSGIASEMDEVARVDLLVKPLTAPLESLTISFDQWKGGCVLNLRWEATEASVLLAEKK